MFHRANPRHHHMSAPADSETFQYLEKLRVGSDCSGLGTEFFALNALGVHRAVSANESQACGEGLAPVRRARSCLISPHSRIAPRPAAAAAYSGVTPPHCIYSTHEHAAMLLCSAWLAVRS